MAPCPSQGWQTGASSASARAISAAEASGYQAPLPATMTGRRAARLRSSARSRPGGTAADAAGAGPGGAAAVCAGGQGGVVLVLAGQVREPAEVGQAVVEAQDVVAVQAENHLEAVCLEDLDRGVARRDHSSSGGADH